MTALTIPLPDDLADAASRLAAARRVPVERLVADLVAAAVAEGALLAEPFVPHNPSHRRIMAALERGPEAYETPREELHDRDRARAEAYAAARARLLALVDASEGRMGPEGWSRSVARER